MAAKVMTITITTLADGYSVGSLNAYVGQSSNPHEGMSKLENLVNAIQAGSIDAEVAVSVSGGASATYNLK